MRERKKKLSGLILTGSALAGMVSAATTTTSARLDDFLKGVKSAVSRGLNTVKNSAINLKKFAAEKLLKFASLTFLGNIIHTEVSKKIDSQDKRENVIEETEKKLDFNINGYEDEKSKSKIKNEQINTEDYINDSRNKEEQNKYETRNALLKGYINDVYNKTGIGALVQKNNNCFIISGIYTQFCTSLKKMNGEIDDIVNEENFNEEKKIKIFISILEKRLNERSEKEPDRFIWKQCLEELNGLSNSGNKDKLKNFVTCALNVILMNRLSWNGFMQEPDEQYKQENNLFGLRVKNTVVDGKKYHFRRRYDQGSPADALGGMGIRLADVGAKGFNYEGINPENDFPYRQVLDKTSEFVTMQYDKNEGFKIIDRTWSKHNSVTIDLGENLGIYLNTNENKNESPVILYENGYVEYDVTDNEVENEQEAKNKYGDTFLKCKKNDGGVEIYEGKKRIKGFKTRKEYLDNYPNGVDPKYEIRTGKDNHTVTLRKKIPNFEMPEEKAEANFNSVNYKAEEKSEVMVKPIPKDFQKKRMYIGAIGYVEEGAAGGGGHCQTLEPKYKWNDEKGYYEIVCWIDRDCLGGAGRVISNDEALGILRDRLGSYNGCKDHTRAGACRLITEQVIDDCPEQYCFNGKDYNDANVKAEHTDERKKQLNEKRAGQEKYNTVQEINSVNTIINEIKKEHPEWFPGGGTANKNGSNTLIGNQNLIEN